MTKEKAVVVYFMCSLARGGGQDMPAETRAKIIRGQEKAAAVLGIPSPSFGMSYPAAALKLLEGEDLGEDSDAAHP